MYRGHNDILDLILGGAPIIAHLNKARSVKTGGPYLF